MTELVSLVAQQLKETLAQLSLTQKQTTMKKIAALKREKYKCNTNQEKRSLELQLFERKDVKIKSTYKGIPRP